MTRILIADEVRLFSDALTSVLQNEEGLRVVGQVAKADDLRHHLKSTSCDVLLISAALPDGRAFELLNVVKEVEAEVKTVIVGVPEVPEHVLAFIECGADGYVVRDRGMDDLITCIRDVTEGRPPLSDKIVLALMERVSRLSGICDKLAGTLADVELTDRETDVLRLVAEGMTNAEIGHELHIEVGTVKTHVHNILGKLNVKDRREAAKYAPLVNFTSPQKSINLVSEWAGVNGHADHL